MVNAYDMKYPVVRFRFHPELIQILSKVSKGFFSPDLAAKHLLIDHLIQRSLVPEDLIKEICNDMVLDYRELKKTLNLSTAQHDQFLQQSIKKIKNAKEKK